MKRILRLGAGCGIEIRGKDLLAVAIKSRPAGVTVLGRALLRDFRDRPPAEWGAEYETFLNNCGVSYLSATLSLPRDEVIVRQIQLPPVTGKELAAAVSYQLDTLHPYGDDEVYYAFAPLKESAAGREQLDVAVVIAEKSKVDAYADMFDAAGLPVSAFTVSGAAFYAGVRVRWDAPPAPFVVADLQDHRLEVYGEGTERPFFSAEFDLQGVTLDRALQLAGADLRLQESEPAALIVCGTVDAGEGPLPGHLESVAGFEPRAVAELLPAPLQSPPEFDARRDAAALAVALEAACPRLGWRANLLPAARRKSNSRWMYAPAAALAVVLVLLLLALWLRPVVQDSRYLAALEQENSTLEAVVQQVDEAESEGANSRRRVDLLYSLRARTRTDLQILSEISQLLPDTVWLGSVEVNDAGVQMMGEAQSAAPLLGIINRSQTLTNAAFMSSLTETETGQRFQIAAERRSDAAEAEPPIESPAESIVAVPPTPAPEAPENAGTLSTLGAEEDSSAGGEEDSSAGAEEDPSARAADDASAGGIQ